MVADRDAKRLSAAGEFDVKFSDSDNADLTDIDGLLAEIPFHGSDDVGGLALPPLQALLSCLPALSGSFLPPPYKHPAASLEPSEVCALEIQMCGAAPPGAGGRLRVAA